MSSLLVPAHFPLPSRGKAATLGHEDRLRDHFLVVHRHVLMRTWTAHLSPLVLSQSDGSIFVSLSMSR